MGIFVLVALIVFGPQAWNRRSRSKVVPAQVLKAHQAVGMVLVLVAIGHGATTCW